MVVYAARCQASRIVSGTVAVAVAVDSTQS